MSKTKAHTRYKNKDGKVVPGVTTILGNLGWNTRTLMAWSRREALEGNDPDKIRDNSADIGTLAHYLCECDAIGAVPDTDEYSPAHLEIANRCYNAYLSWKNQTQIDKIEAEIKVVSERYQFGGQADIILTSGDKQILIDLKTSNGVYPEHHIQSVAYMKALNENGYNISEIYILHLGKDGEFTPYPVTKHRDLWRTFKHCLCLHKLHKVIK